jgi:hypothetical protein
LGLFFTLLLGSLAWAGPSQVGGRTSPDGQEEITIDLPGDKQMHNEAGTDRAGLCVWTSLNHSAYWANIEELFTLQQYMRSQPGGGWPDRVDKVLGKIAPHVEYLQYTGKDPAAVRLALKTGRMPCVTYGYSPRYVSARNPSGRVSHMVNCVHLSDRWACVLDNNFVPETPDQKADPKTYEWMTPDEFLSRWCMTDGTGWAVIPLHVGPPPIPTNGRVQDTASEDRSGIRQNSDAQPRNSGEFRYVKAAIYGQCPNGVCRPGLYEWRTFTDDPAQVALYKNGVQVGAYSYTHGHYRPYDKATDTWGQPCQPPLAPPAPNILRPSDCPCTPGNGCDGDCRSCRCRPAGGEAVGGPCEDFGVNKDKIHEEGYSIQGRKVTSDQAHKLLVEGSTPLADDSNKLRLTVIGTAAECARVVADLQSNPALAKLKDRLLVQCYRHGDWAVSPVKLEDGGTPDIVVQDPPGTDGKAKVRLRWHDYGQGPERLAEAIRKADPAYNPKADPTGPTAPPAPPPPVPEPPTPGGGLLADILASPLFWGVVSMIIGFLIRQFVPALYPLWLALANRLQPPVPAAPDNKLLTDILARLAKRLEELGKPTQPPTP